MHTHSKLLGGDTSFGKTHHHHLLLNNLLTWACVNFSGSGWMTEAGQENVLIWSQHRKLAPKRISAPNPNNAPINLLNYIIYHMVLSCHDNPKSIAAFHGLRLRSHQIQRCGKKRWVFHSFSLSPLHFFCAASVRKNPQTSAATEVETVSTFQPPLSTSCCIGQSCLPTWHNGSRYVALPEAVPDVLRLPVDKISNSAGADSLCPVALTSTVIKCSGKTCFDATSWWIFIYFGPKPISRLKIRCWLWLLRSMSTLNVPRVWPRRFVDFSSALTQSNLN